MRSKAIWRNFLTAAICCLLGANWSFASPQGPMCKGNKQVVGDCFTVHGRMREGNGGPGIRIWRIGTDRMLGVWGADENDPDVAWLPDRIYRMLDDDHQVFADFLVCPLTKQTEDEMQIVCVESATGIVRAVIPPQKKEW
jgi:hypothetical protein